MTNEEAINILKNGSLSDSEVDAERFNKAYSMAIKALEQQPCGMTVEEYRQRMIDAFHNADCDNLIALVALPSEKEFEHLEWLLKKHYHNQKQQPCEDAISRKDMLAVLSQSHSLTQAWDGFEKLPPVTPKEKTGHWEYVQYDGNPNIGNLHCSECNRIAGFEYNFCPNCGARMVSE